MSAIVRPGLLGCAVALVLAFGGCGGGQRTTTATAAGARVGAGQALTVRFTGGSVPGTVYLGAGPDSQSIDAYRLNGPFSNAERLTYSPVGLGINGLVANQRDVLIQRICCDNLNFIELLNLARRGGLPGTVVGTGDAVAVASDGRFAHAVPDYQGCRCDALLVRPSLHGSDRVVYRVPHPGQIVSGAWSASNRLAILVGTTTADASVTHSEIVLDPGTSAQRTIHPRVAIAVETGIWWGPRGELSYELSNAPRVVIRLPTGQTRSFLAPLTQVTCWLPNDTIFTFNVGKHTFGTMNPGSGAITTIGRYASYADIFVLDCAR